MIHTSRQLKDFIRNLSKTTGMDAQILIRKYMMERFLERISVSKYRERFILKGGMLVSAFVGAESRATMDIDTTIKGISLSVEEMKRVISEISDIHLNDNVLFRIKAVIYVGLIYLGASVSSFYPADIERSQLLLGIAERVLGKEGMLFLSIAVVLACVTTAIGQITSIANFFHDFSGKKIPHKPAALFFAVLGAAIAILGVERIVYFATPIYKGVYPSLIVLMILGIFRKYIPNRESFRYALIFTLAVSILEAVLSVADVGVIKAFIEFLPLSGLGFAWLLPATLGFIVGAVKGKEPLTQFA